MPSFLPALAEAALDPTWSYNMGIFAVGGIAVIASIVSIWSALWGRRRTEVQQPLEVAHAKEFATKHELQRVDQRVTDLDKSVDDRFAAAAHAGSESREKMYLSIRKLEQSTAALERSAELQSAQQVQMDNKLDRLLERFADQKNK